MTMKKGDKRRNGLYGEKAWMHRIKPNLKGRENLWIRGEKNPKAKVTAEAVYHIRQIKIIPYWLAKKIARALGIHPDYVYSLKGRRTWKHLK